MARLRPASAEPDPYAPPSDRFVPAVLPGAGVVGAGPEVRVVPVSRSVWPRSVTAEPTVFRTALRKDAGDGGRPPGRAPLGAAAAAPPGLSGRADGTRHVPSPGIPHVPPRPLT